MNFLPEIPPKKLAPTFSLMECYPGAVELLNKTMKIGPRFRL